MSRDRDANGKFVNGNGVNQPKPPQVKSLRELTKIEVMRCAASLCRPMIDIEEECARKSVSGLQHLTNTAIASSSPDTGFIKWLIEMAIGKPTQQIIETKEYVPQTIIHKLDGEKVVYNLVDKEDVQ